MYPDFKDYRELPVEDSGIVCGGQKKTSYPVSERWNIIQIRTLIAILALSLVANAVTVYNHFVVKGGTTTSEKPSRYAHLTKTIMKPFNPDALVHMTSEAHADAFWDNINLDAGIVALPHQFVEEQGLPEAFPFPWEPTRGVYLLNGYHSVHCLKRIRKTIVELRRGEEPSYPWAHTDHCLSSLLDDAFCAADDTPKKDQDSPGTQYRQCRDWSELEAWARQHTACYKFINETSSTLPLLDRYQFCPADSPYWGEVRKWYPDAVPY
ncbi:hypothetical protein MMC25_006139 [Agyrium rufum]|nr:hypothetical protein [Agyrium rufum]